MSVLLEGMLNIGGTQWCFRLYVKQRNNKSNQEANNQGKALMRNYIVMGSK